MHHIDRIADVQSFALPARLRRARIDTDTERVVLRSEVLDRIDPT
jgi:hypothetical protein